MPPDTGMAFVLVSHLDPTHKSILSELIRSYTRMQVKEVEDAMLVAPNTIYVIPPDRDMALMHGKLHLMEPSAPRGLRQPIDFFFRSLSQDKQEKAIAIVLSGTGTEGTLGLREVKGQGGMVMVQDPETAKYNGMPRSAIGTGLVDYVSASGKNAGAAHRVHPASSYQGTRQNACNRTGVNQSSAQDFDDYTHQDRPRFLFLQGKHDNSPYRAKNGRQ